MRLLTRLNAILIAIALALGAIVVMQLRAYERLDGELDGMHDAQTQIALMFDLDQAIDREIELADRGALRGPEGRRAIAATHQWIRRLHDSVESEGDPEEMRLLSTIEALQARVEVGEGGDHDTAIGQVVSQMVAHEQEDIANVNLDQRDQALVISVGSAIVIVVLGLGILLGVAVPLRRYLARLIREARAIADGDLTTPMLIEGPGELREVGSAVDEMRVQLAERLAIQQANARVLADRVEELQQARAGLETSERMATVGMLAAGIAHELANPMTCVVSAIQLAQEMSPDDPDHADVLGEARASSERVIGILTDLKTFSRGLSVPTKGVVVKDVFDQVLQLTASQIRRVCRVVRDEEADLPPASGEDQRLVQVMLNLVINAVQAFPGQSPSNTITLRARRRDAQISICVEDNGPGIAPEHAAKLFQPFFSTKPVGQGTGLGLSVCRNLIDAMGGSIDFETAVGRGTTFEIRLPIREGAVRQPPTSTRLQLVS